MKRNNVDKRKGAGNKKYCVIVDGETEIWYFQMMKQHETLHKVDVTPELPKKKKLREQYHIVIAKSNDYDHVYWMLDFDVILKESKETPKGQTNKIVELEGYCKQLKEYDNITVLINNPCLEYWYLLHLNSTSKFFDHYDNGLEKELQKNTLLKDYEKTEGFYKKKNNDIYKKLKPYQNTAKVNAEKLGNFDFENCHNAKAEIYKFFEIIT